MEDVKATARENRISAWSLKGQAARDNLPPSAKQLALVPDEQYQSDENVMMIDKEEHASLEDVSISVDLLRMHPGLGCVGLGFVPLWESRTVYFGD